MTPEAQAKQDLIQLMLKQALSLGMTFEDCLKHFHLNDPTRLGYRAPNNADRAKWAQEAVSAFQQACRTDDSDAISDLLCDLMHLCHQSQGKFDFECELARGERAYQEELEEERPSQFQNRYSCPRCNAIWTDTWSSTVDDDCPTCGQRHVSPYESVELEPETGNPP